MKLLIHREKREVVDGRELVVAKSKQYLVSDFSKVFHTMYGDISKDDLSKPSGSVLKSSTGKEFLIIDASYVDIVKRFRKLPQTVPMKDIGLIIATTGINKDSVIVEGGLGSGAVAAGLAHIAKHVISYDIRDDCINNAKANLDMLNIKNSTIKKQSLYDGIDEVDVDLVFLDVPEPWRVVRHAVEALKVGAFLVSYSPTVPQVQQFVDEVNKTDELLVLKTTELIERPWVVDGRRVRPNNSGIGHSGFMTFVRKIRV